MIAKIDPKELPGRATSYNNIVTADVRDFVNSDWTAAEVKCEKYKTAHSACAAYRSAIKRMGVKVLVMERNDRLFLVKE